ncbi:MAG: VWA domain-containing protein [Desulfosarcina sp.]|jgi:Ca-activated chloride channel family protein
MTFFRIEMLFFIWAIPLLVAVVVYGNRRRRDILQRFSSAHGLDTIAPDTMGGRRWIKAALLMASVLFVAIALAGPKYGFRWREIRQRGVDIVIALDCSRSMTAADVQPSRLERAKREVFDLLAMLQGDRVGLVAFAGTAYLQCPLTLDYDAFNLFLNVLSPDYLPVGGTDITAALQTAMGSFDPKSPAEKAIILITDGENTGSGDPLKAAEALKRKEIKLFCIGVGGAEGVPIPEASGGFKKDRTGQIVLSQRDETTLKKMAVITDGTYVRSVAGNMDLDAIYTDEIRSKMDAQTLTSGRKQVWEDRFQWPLALALICLVAELLLPVTRKSALALILSGWLILPMVAAEAGETRDGIAAYEQGEFETALKHFTDAQLNEPEAPHLLYNVAGAYYKTGDFDAAADHFRQVLKTDDNELKRKALYNLGNAEFRRGNAAAAIGHYEAALKIAPDDRLAKENLEFVKQVLAQQQQSTDGTQDPNQGKQDQQDDAESNQAQDSPSQQDREQGQQGADDDRAGSDEQQRQFGDQMNDQQAGQQAAPSETDPSQEQTAAPARQTEDQGGDPGQAERMLNRLQDQPGRALMPAPGRRIVEKDW